MTDPMTNERVTEIVRAATHGKAIVLAGLVRDAAHIDTEKKEEFRKALGTVWMRGVRELAAEVRRQRTALADAETRVFNAFADADSRDLNAMTVTELTTFVMRAVRGGEDGG